MKNMYQRALGILVMGMLAAACTKIQPLPLYEKGKAIYDQRKANNWA
jgi:hypothetical protein